MLKIDNIGLWMSVKHEEISLAASSLLQSIINSLTGEGKKEEHGKEGAIVLGNWCQLQPGTFAQPSGHLASMCSGQLQGRS